MIILMQLENLLYSLKMSNIDTVFNLDNMFDESTTQDNEIMEKLFSKINPRSREMLDAYKSCHKEIMERKIKEDISKIILGDQPDKKKIWFRNKVIEKITPSAIDKFFEAYETEEGIEKAIKQTFNYICDNENHNYYINGGVLALEQSIRLNLKTDDSKFNGLDLIVKKIFSKFKDIYDQMMKPNKIDKAFDENKGAIIYERFHNIPTLPLVSSYFDLKEEINVKKVIEQDDVNALENFDKKNPFVIYSNRVFDLCAYCASQQCFAFFYGLITQAELVLEDNFYKMASSNLAKDIPLNYAGYPFYKTAQKCQVITKGPDEAKILSMNKSIISESVFWYAFNGGADRKDMKNAIDMINLLKKYKIVASDVAKYNFSKVGGAVSGYTSVIVSYLNSCLR